MLSYVVRKNAIPPILVNTYSHEYASSSLNTQSPTKQSYDLEEYMPRSLSSRNGARSCVVEHQSERTGNPPAIMLRYFGKHLCPLVMNPLSVLYI